MGEPDLVLELPEFEVPAHGRDIYRNFVAPAAVLETRWVKAVDIRPGDPTVVHHARLMVDTTHSSADLDAADPASGFDGMELVSAALNPPGFFVGWTPGKVVSIGETELAWPLRPDSDVVVQLHLRPQGAPVSVRARVGLYFAAAPPTRRPSLITLSSDAINIPAGEEAYVVQDEYSLPVEVEVLGVYPHAHYLAKRMEGFATLPDGSRRWLIVVENWDFNWQDDYRYADPLRLPAGSTLTMRYMYDNSVHNPSNPHHPPRRVRYGPESTDEMADLILQVLTRSESDRGVLEQDLRWRSYARDAVLEAREYELRADSLVVAGSLEEALEAYRQSLQLSSDPRVMSSMARILIEAGNADAAVLVAEQAVALSENTDPSVLKVLANAYEAVGRLAEAQEALRKAEQAAERLEDHRLADSLRKRR